MNGRREMGKNSVSRISLSAKLLEIFCVEVNSFSFSLLNILNFSKCMKKALYAPNAIYSILSLIRNFHFSFMPVFCWCSFLVYIDCMAVFFWIHRFRVCHQTATERLRQFQMNGGPQHSFEETIHRVSVLNFILILFVCSANRVLRFIFVGCGHTFYFVS